MDCSAPGQRPQWMATEYVAAPSLADWVSAHGPLPRPALLSLAAELCAAVRAVHQAGLAHRDIKPGNVLLARDRPRLIDFGVARAADDSRHTRVGVSVGSPGFLAPDQAVGGVAAAPADMFSLAALLVYAATGRSPFSHAGEEISAAALLYRVVHKEPDLTGVDPLLVPLLSACLAKDPAERPTADRLGAWLAETGGRIGSWSQERPTALAGTLTDAEHAARTVVDLAHNSETLLAGQESPPGAAAPAGSGRRRRLTWLLATAVAVAAVVVAVVAAVHFGTHRSAAEPSPSKHGRSSRSTASATAGSKPTAGGTASAPAPESQPGSTALRTIQATFELATGEAVRAGARTLVMQKDGNLVIYDQDGKVRWASATQGDGNSARFQPDGNLVVYDRQGQALWASQTGDYPGAVLVFQADGNVLIKSGDTVLWAADTQD